MIAYPMLSKFMGEYILSTDILPYLNDIRKITGRFDLDQYLKKVKWPSSGARIEIYELKEIRQQFEKIFNNMKQFPSADDLRRFDRSVAEIVYRTLRELPPSIASNQDFWNFMNVILLPELAAYRWRGRDNSLNHERFVGSPRNYLGSIWWRVRFFYDSKAINPWSVFEGLSEDNFVSIMERPKLRGYESLPLCIGRVILRFKANGFPANKIQDLVRKSIIDLRIQALAIDFNVFSEAELEEFVYDTFKSIKDDYF